MQFPWPGNVRGLRGVIEFGVIQCQGPLIDVEDLPPEIAGAPRATPRLKPKRPPRPIEQSPRVDEERTRLLDALQRAKGNRTAAARLLGIGRATFYRRVEALGIRIDPES